MYNDPGSDMTLTSGSLYGYGGADPIDNTELDGHSWCSFLPAGCGTINNVTAGAVNGISDIWLIPAHWVGNMILGVAPGIAAGQGTCLGCTAGAAPPANPLPISPAHWGNHSSWSYKIAYLLAPLLLPYSFREADWQAASQKDVATALARNIAAAAAKDAAAAAAKEAAQQAAASAASDAADASAAAAERGARFAGGSDGVGADTQPDLPGLARMHAEELISAGGKVPRAASAVVDTSTWTPYFGQSGSIPSGLDPELASRFPNPSLEDWPLGGCNAAVLNGASLENLIYSTVKIGRTGIEPFPSCQNCQVILEGAKEVMP